LEISEYSLKNHEYGWMLETGNLQKLNHIYGKLSSVKKDTEYIISLAQNSSWTKQNSSWFKADLLR
jgi:hypothetical protein